MFSFFNVTPMPMPNRHTRRASAAEARKERKINARISRREDRETADKMAAKRPVAVVVTSRERMRHAALHRALGLA